MQSTFTEDTHQCLPKVLSEKQPVILKVGRVYFCSVCLILHVCDVTSLFPIFKFLALQDFALLSQHSPSRRSEVFSLSQPGVLL